MLLLLHASLSLTNLTSSNKKRVPLKRPSSKVCFSLHSKTLCSISFPIIHELVTLESFLHYLMLQFPYLENERPSKAILR